MIKRDGGATSEKVVREGSLRGQLTKNWRVSCPLDNELGRKVPEEGWQIQCPRGHKNMVCSGNRQKTSVSGVYWSEMDETGSSRSLKTSVRVTGAIRVPVWSQWRIWSSRSSLAVCPTASIWIFAPEATSLVELDPEDKSTMVGRGQRWIPMPCLRTIRLQNAL